MEKTAKNQTLCLIQWNVHSLTPWQARFAQVSRSTLLQSADYAEAMARLNHQRITRGIITLNGQEAGLVQILEAGILKNAVHGVLLDRGPLWFGGYGTPENFERFLDAFTERYPKRFARRIRFIPEMENTPQNRPLMEAHGFRPAHPGSTYQTVWLDLRPDMDRLHKRLNPKWRSTLRQAQRAGLTLAWNKENTYFPWLMAHYADDKARRGYDGPSVKTVHALAHTFSRGQNMLIGTAILDHAPIAAILLLIHGGSATYQIGYTSERGRQVRAHYALLWSALERLKERGIYDFDLGGVNEETARGIKRFKSGMGGTIRETLGLYH